MFKKYEVENLQVQGVEDITTSISHLIEFFR